VNVESSQEHTAFFYVPVSLMLQREIQMQATARTHKIGRERWSSSRLFRLWKRQQLVLQQTQNNYVAERGEIILRVAPEVSFQNSKSCSSFRWKPWLTTCIRSYYTCGNLRIPDECSGDDVLLALEYFGILTASASDFVFDSKHAFSRIQAWSRYFEGRVHLAETLLEDYDDVEIKDNEQNGRSNELGSHTLVWVLFQEEEDVENEHDDFKILEHGACNQKPEYRSLNLNGENIRRLTVREQGGLYDLFCGKRNRNNKYAGEICEEKTEENALTKQMPLRMRYDFCEYVRQSLPSKSNIWFSIERVEVTSKSNTNRAKSGVEIRPVIRINRDRRVFATMIPKNEEQIKSTNIKDGNGFKNINNNKSSVQDKSVNLARYQLQNSLLDLESNATNHSSHMETLPGKGRLKWNYDRSEYLHLPHSSDKEEGSVLASDPYTNIRYNASTSSLLHTEQRNSDLESRKSVEIVEVMSKPKPSEMKSVIDINNAKKPIKYVNMELGDLRSVTSVLSEPVLDDRGALNEFYSTIKSMNYKVGKYDQAKRIVRERCQEIIIKTPPRTTRNLVNTPPWDKEQHSVRSEEEIQKGESSRKENKKVAINGETNSEAQANESRENEGEGSESGDDNENLDEQPGISPTDFHGSWGQLLASVCESIIPSQSRNYISHSPIRQFTVSSNKSTSSSVSSSDDEHQAFYVCPIREGTESTSKPNEFVDQAKKLGSELSDQFDELMKVAYNNDNYQVETKGSLKEIPEILSIRSDEDRTMTSCLASSIVGRTSRTFEECRRKSDECASDNFTSDRRSFDIDSFNKSADAMPHRSGESKPRTASRKHKKGLVTRMKTIVSSPKCEANVLSKRRDGHKRYPKIEERASVSSSTRESTAGINMNNYNKENRYSRRENRFYS
ncbi:MAG: hypothetical protein ACI8RD_003271, partial [Bacillariaceae sp.]|jgi:hypothetical protein